MKSEIGPSIRLVIGIILGIGIAAVDNLAFGGEVSPIVIMLLLLAAAATVMTLWGRRGAFAAFALWACLPLAHFVKHLLGLPDTLHPNSYESILKLAGFSFAVTAIGAGCGGVFHRTLAGEGKKDETANMS